MPRVNWGINSSVIDEFDREAQFKPYTGPVPENGVYQWRVKNAVSVAGTKEKYPQLRVTLELEPRYREEKKFAGYTLMKFMSVADQTAFQYVPFFDAIGITGKDFTLRTFTDEQGNVKKIGPWRNNGKTSVLGLLESSKGENADRYPKQIGWVGVLEEETEEEEIDEDTEDEEEPF